MIIINIITRTVVVYIIIRTVRITRGLIFYPITHYNNIIRGYSGEGFSFVTSLILFRTKGCARVLIIILYNIIVHISFFAFY